MTLDANDQIWKKTVTLPAGTYNYKAAIDGSWTENWGANGKRDGGNISLVMPTTGEVTFYYDHTTHWITTSIPGPIVTAAGSFQSELGCSSDWAPDCMRAWLKDVDGDGTYTFSTNKIPAGSYDTKVAHGLSWDENYGAGGAPGGANISFTVAAGAKVTFSYVLATHVLTVTSSTAASAADPTKARAQWLDKSWLAWDLPAAAANWTFRLSYSKQAGLELDSEAITGGPSVGLTLGSLPTKLTTKFPAVAKYDGLRLPDWVSKDRKLLAGILSGQIALAAYDDLGRLVDATSVQMPGVLDALYPGAVKRALGISWHSWSPILSVWAPTAQNVKLVIDPAGSAPQQVLAMHRDDDGVWLARGNTKWRGATYVYRVTVFDPDSRKLVTSDVTDPYSVALTLNSTASVIADLDDTTLKPSGWDSLKKPKLAQPEDSTIYELQIRDFSIGDNTVPAAHRGGYLAFTDAQSDGMKHLKALSAAGMNTLHLLPVFDIATINENKSEQATPDCDLPALSAADPAGEAQQACVAKVVEKDGFNWGYDPYHYTVPEGSYASNQNGAARTKEFRQMVAGVNGAGLRVVMDVVYNHTAASGQAQYSVLDKVVPGYYQRLSATGSVENSTCCANTAAEHAMMQKLMVDSVVTWARDYKVDGFRFDLMGHHPKSTILAIRAALDKLTLRHDGVDGKKVYLYGEGWNFGEVADNALFVQATQANMAGTGVGTFNDRLRDSVRGGGPFDDDPRLQGFGSGLYTDPNVAPGNGSADTQLATLLLDQDRIKIGLTGNLAGYTFVDRTGATVNGAQVDYNGQPTGYTADPSETISYVDAHDNETLFDTLTYKLPQSTSMADRVRMNTLSLATTALGQGPSFWHAGADLLRSKSLDRNSFNSGDWFNRIDWSGQNSTFGSGLPLSTDNSAKWSFMKPLLSDSALKPTPADIKAAGDGSVDLLKLRFSSPLFRLGSAALIQQKVSFPSSGPGQTPGVIVMQLDDRVGPNIDPKVQRIIVVFNASAVTATVAVVGNAGMKLSPIQATGSDPVLKTSVVAAGSVQVPARTVAVFVQ
ncbi:pullulanase-type alpha-1,6-glucosidase [Nakamurella sp. UYEF19]|uniref:pullulanase-type alpha-1,6-glucosidase n=1 Tax=Nakamurella sp. UYEF19 TaxID=1756392 RepID=UPI00339505F8